MARQLSLINQIPSSLAGAVTGAVGVGKMSQSHSGMDEKTDGYCWRLL